MGSSSFGVWCSVLLPSSGQECLKQSAVSKHLRAPVATAPIDLFVMEITKRGM
jgi:hypothetical protein